MSIWLIILMIAIGVFVVTELLTGVIPFGIGTAISALVTYGFSFLIQSSLVLGIIFVMIAVVLEALFIRTCLKKIKPRLSDDDRAIGKQAKVIERIDSVEETGKVKVLGNVWKAKTLDKQVIEVDEVVCIEKIEGVSVVVSRVEKKE